MNYLGQWSNLELIRQDGTTRPAAEVLRDVQYVVFLFGASWYPECERFFPLLEAFYEQHHVAKSFEVIYICRDYNRGDMLRGFLTQERAVTAAAREQRRERKEARRRLHHDGDHHPSEGAAEGDDSGTTQHDGSAANVSAEPTAPVTRRSRTHSSEEAERRADGAASTPPPLKRVAELAPGTATNSFSGPTSAAASDSSAAAKNPPSGGFWAVPYDHVGAVGVPLLYHLRVFSYPGVVVCRNTAFSADVPLQTLPELPPHHARAVPAGAEGTDRTNAPRRYEMTPKVARRECQPEVLSISGRFMIETQDPSGEHFPWDHMGSQTRFAAMLFLAVVVAVSAVVLSVVIPAIISMHAMRKATAAAAAAAAAAAQD